MASRPKHLERTAAPASRQGINPNPKALKLLNTKPHNLRPKPLTPKPLGPYTPKPHIPEGPLQLGLTPKLPSHGLPGGQT